MGVSQQIAQEIVRAKFEDIPEKALERIRRGILDTIGVAFFGYQLNPRAASLIEYAKELGYGVPESTIIGDGTKVSCVFAAGANAAAANGAGTCFSEAGPGLHALINIVQTGVAVAERVGANGKELITAVALAYEINGRFARAAFPLEIMHGKLPKRDASFPGHHRHYGATAAITAAKLLGLEEEQVNAAIGIGWHYTPILAPSDEGGSMKPQMPSGGIFNLGACDWGIQAAFMARKGFQGPRDFVEKEARYDLDRMVASPSPYHYTGNELHLKPWISGRGTQPGLSASLAILKEEGIKAEDIEQITFRAKDEYLHHPFTSTEPKEYREIINSVPWAIARALLGYQPGPEWLKEEVIKDPAALSLAKKVKIEELPRITEMWDTGVMVANEAFNEVEVVANGKVYKKTRTYGETEGSSLNPMPREWLDRKFMANSTPVIGEKQGEELLTMLSRLEEEQDVRNITKLFARR